MTPPIHCTYIQADQADQADNPQQEYFVCPWTGSLFNHSR